MKYFISYGTYFIILIIILQFIYLDEQRKQLHTKKHTHKHKQTWTQTPQIYNNTQTQNSPNSTHCKNELFSLYRRKSCKPQPNQNVKG